MYREIVKDVYWVGAKDPDLRVFDVIMETEWGTTYNSYLIKGEDKIALVELVKNQFGQGHIDAIRELVAPEDIDYIIINHTEPDHSGSTADFLKEAKNATVVSSRVANTFLKSIVNDDFPHMIVGDGDSIDLGGKTLKFINAPHLHWPDSMFTYLEEDNILFPGDVFGCHFCPEGHVIFDDEVEMDFVPAQKYYFDVIMSPFKEHMLKAIDKIRDLDIDIICSGHGPILRTDPWATIDRVEGWSKDILDKNDPKKIFIAYVSAYGNTQRIGEAIADGIREVSDFDVEMLDVSTVDVSVAAEKVEKADGVLVGSPTINRDALLPMWEFLAHVNAFKNKGKPAAAFGSYGWSGEAVAMMSERLKSLGLKVTSPGYRVKLVPDEDDLHGAKEFGKEFANAMK